MGPLRRSFSIICLLPFFYLFCTARLIQADRDRVNIAELSGTWRMVEVFGKPTPSQSKIFFRLDGEILSGFDGCNRFSGPILQPERIRSTGRGCEDDQIRLPLSLERPADHLLQSVQTGNILVLPLAGNSTAVFLKEEE